MDRLEDKLWHRIDRRRVPLLTTVAALDAGLLVPLGYGLLGPDTELVLVVAPTYSALFLVLAFTLAALADRGLVSWQFFAPSS